MAKYLFEVSYTAEGARGLLAQGGSARVAAAKAAIESVGGKLETFYFAFGDTDVYAIGEAPDAASAAAFALTIAGSGAVTTRTVVLLTPEELDAASAVQVGYQPPGS